MVSNKTNEVNPFAKELWSKLELILSNLPPKSERIAAFDADGTLWDFDLGEHFFEFQIKNSGLTLPPNPMQHYIEMKNPDPRVAYVWLAQINAGLPLQKIRDWAQKNIETVPKSFVFEDMQKWIQRLRDLDFKIYVITASIKWAVEPGAKRFYNIPFENVLGVETFVDKGVITQIPVTPITWRDGKAEALLKATNGVQPFFCAGNTSGDSSLLKLAKHALALRTQSKPSKLFDDEQSLAELASKNGWLTHHFGAK